MISLFFAVLLLTLINPTWVFAGETVTIVGTVNDDFTFIDDEGNLYLIAETETGYQVAENAGVRFSITGTIEAPCSKLQGIFPVRKMSILISLANPAASCG